MRPAIGILVVTILAAAAAAGAEGGTVVSGDEGARAGGDRRGLVDTVGYATTAVSMDAVVARARELAAPRADSLRREGGIGDGGPLIAVVSPHDDYAYAGRLYELAIPRIRAKRVILFGVFHKARLFECRDRLVFGSFRAWTGPYGPVRVSPLRDEILAGLSDRDYVVSDEMQAAEHSVEGIVPWLQAGNRDVEIVSILVPYMDWPTLERLAGDLAGTLAPILREKGWRLGEDVAFVVSSDAVHYGDAGWGGSNYAEFGADVHGYERAVERDRAIATTYLTGHVEPRKLRGFLDTCVDSTDVTKYRITWCGRFSIPLGLLVAEQVTGAVEARPLNGALLDYGTSVGEAFLEAPGIGVTAPNDFHHWVGYAALGYR